MPENADTFDCEICAFKCSKYSNYTKHLMTAKHTNRTNRTKMYPKNALSEFVCACGKVYKARNSLWYHKRVCNLVNQEPVTDSQQSQTVDMSLVFELLKQNQEFKELMIEQSKQLADQQQQNNQLLDAVRDGKLGNNNNNNNNSYHNTTNNRFNLNLFLNETCKDAITMDDFIKSFEVTRDDFIHTGNVGFIEGISTVMLNRFRNMDMHTRPLHCTDLKRETVYIKNSDKWEKEDNNKTHLRKAVKVVAHRNMNELWRWYNDSKPEVEQIGSDECENYFKYYKAALGGCGKEEDIKFEDKIIKNVLKEVQVDKTALTVL